MSYNVIAYQVDSEKIKSIWGSHDVEFVDSLLSKYKNDIRFTLESFEIDLDIYKAHLNDIVKGRITNNDHNYLYGYLYELLCQNMGARIESGEFMCYLEEATDNNHKAFIPIPGNDDWPEFYSIHVNELENGRQEFLNNKEAYAKEDYYIDEVNKIFDIAIKNEKDVVFFGY